MSDKKLSVWTIRGFGDEWPMTVRGPKLGFAEEVEVIPVDSPNVLSVEEANDLAVAYFTGAPAALERAEGTISRLAEWVEEEEDPPLTEADVADGVARGILSVEEGR